MKPESDNLVKEVLNYLYSNSPFKSPFEDSSATYRGYIGPFTVTVPNTASRKKIAPYHDIHHLLTGYDTSRIGEGEIGAWELGTGLISRPVPFFLNWSAMSTGLYYSPTKTYKAFMKGSSCKTLYDLELEEVLAMRWSDVETYVANGEKKNNFISHLRFICLSMGSLVMLFLSPFAAILDKVISKL